MSRQNIVSTIVRLLLLSLVVGLVLSFLDITPENLLTAFGDTIERIVRLAVRFGTWAMRYIFVGAVVVLPIWLLFAVLRLLRQKGKS